MTSSENIKSTADMTLLKRGFGDVELPDIPDVPGMIKREEGQYLYWLGSNLYTGRGAAIEIGTWLGKSTLHLAAGLSSNRLANKLVCYDHFQWAGGANWSSKAKSPRTLEAGDDFMQDFLDNVADYSDLIDARRSKIENIEFDADNIELLILDAPKRAADIFAVMNGVADKVIPGHTIIAWQDFLHPASFEIPAVLADMAAFQTPAHIVDDGTMVGFQVEKRWTAADVTKAALGFRNWSLEECSVAWESWRSIVPTAAWPSFQSGLSMLLHDNGMIDEACRLLETIIDDKLCKARWQKWRKTSIPARYPRLFEAKFVDRTA
ncbi:class I SAM-dependent methyltransferase [Flavimaricola marinus]|uniref:Methyltransferase domain protein n=1 Tax=Flavimaricola marinus TaxID=1819565 RepID=A0A238LLD6_9RHOB|nr:class I SAM-dependent methyltransferase [Flavimaricola marinus]SMY10363.1 hypothetical protein LOM8899_04538 [Flavimaricola marinus]